MKAIVQERYGPPEVLHLADIALPSPGDDEVLIRVHAAGVDAGVWHLTAGLPYLVRVMGFGLRRPRERVRGDVAGVVEAVGSRVVKFSPGDAVFGVARGAFAEHAVAEQDKVLPKPAHLSFEQAAVVPISAMTALQAVREVGGVLPGQRVLVIGAAGGVGTFAVQMAVADGAIVTGVCSTSKIDLVQSLGAKYVIDYTRDDFADTGQAYDVILDLAGNRSISHLRLALAPHGTLVIVGGEGGSRLLGGMTRQLRAVVLSPFVHQNLKTFVNNERPEQLAAFQDLLERRKIAPVIDREFTLDEVPDAIRYQRQGKARGKVVVTDIA
jgi:NADPH:quinone reductase-like Zn-dependent oxidoreductase